MGEGQGQVGGGVERDGASDTAPQPPPTCHPYLGRVPERRDVLQLGQEARRAGAKDGEDEDWEEVIGAGRNSVRRGHAKHLRQSPAAVQHARDLVARAAEQVHPTQVCSRGTPPEAVVAGLKGDVEVAGSDEAQRLELEVEGSVACAGGRDEVG